MFIINNSIILNKNIDILYKNFLRNIIENIFNNDENKIKNYYKNIKNNDETLTITNQKVLKEKFNFLCLNGKYENNYINFKKFIIDHEYKKYILQSNYSYLAFIKNNGKSNSFIGFNNSTMYIHIEFDNLPIIPNDIYKYFKKFLTFEFKKDSFNYINTKPNVELLNKIYYLEFTYFIEHNNDYIGDWIYDKIKEIKMAEPLFCLFGHNLSKKNYIINLYSHIGNIDIIYELCNNNIKFISNFINGMIIHDKFEYTFLKTIDGLFPEAIYKNNIFEKMFKLNI